VGINKISKYYFSLIPVLKFVRWPPHLIKGEREHENKILSCCSEKISAQRLSGNPAFPFFHRPPAELYGE
jgi:hypothetical protein